MLAVKGIYSGERLVQLERDAPVNRGSEVIVTFVGSPQENENNLSERQAAFQHLLGMIKGSKKTLPADFDDKAEWHKHLDEKYGNID
jgi:hypothetical protein